MPQTPTAKTDAKKTILVTFEGDRPEVPFSAPAGAYLSLRDKALAVQAIRVQYNRYMRTIRRAMEKEMTNVKSI